MEHIDYHHISKAFRHKAEWTDAEPLSFVNDGADLYNLSFTSAHAHHLLGYSHYRCEAHERVHESPFVCPDQNQSARRFITEFLDLDRYGAVFEEFIERAVTHLGIPLQPASGDTTAWHTRKTEDDSAGATMN